MILGVEYRCFAYDILGLTDRSYSQGDRSVDDGVEQRNLLAELEGKLQNSNLCRLMQELLNNYLLLEHFYMEESVKKAIQLDSVETGTPTSSMIDDVFFIVKKCIR